MAALVVLLTMSAAQAGPGAPGVAVPLGLDHNCADPRWPALAGPWVVACGPEGKVDRVLSLETGRELRLPRGLTTLAAADSLLVAVGREAGSFRLEQSGVVELDHPKIRSLPVASPATDGRRAAMLTEQGASAWELDSATRTVEDAAPVGWYPPALAGDRLAWVQIDDATGEDLWWVDLADSRAEPELLAGGPDHQRHVAGSANWLAWTDSHGITVMDVVSRDQRWIPADTGFSAPLSLWQDVVCWETRPGHGVAEEGDGVDIHCSDGMAAAGPGHQQWPSRWGPWLLYRQDGRTWLKTSAAQAAEPEQEPEAPAEARTGG